MKKWLKYDILQPIPFSFTGLILLWQNILWESFFSFSFSMSCCTKCQCCVYCNQKNKLFTHSGFLFVLASWTRKALSLCRTRLVLFHRLEPAVDVQGLAGRRLPSPSRPRPPSWPCCRNRWAPSTLRRPWTLATCACRCCRACSPPQRCSSRGTGRLLASSRCWGNWTPVICPRTCPWSNQRAKAPKSAWNRVLWSKRGVPNCNHHCWLKILWVEATETASLLLLLRDMERGGDTLVEGSSAELNPRLQLNGYFECLLLGIINVYIVFNVFCKCDLNEKF